MWLYVGRRILLGIVIFCLAVTLLHVMIRAVPGDPASIMLGPRATAEQRQELRDRMHLDAPAYEQLAVYFTNLARGDLGTDVKTGRDVSTMVFERVPHTVALILASIAWAVAIGIPLGCYSAMRRNTVIDKLTGVLSVSVIAVPSFVMALYAMLIFAVTLNWFPSMGIGEGGFLERLHHLALPAFAVGVAWVGYIARVVRASMLEVLGETHVRMSHAFGLPEMTIVLRYILPIAILPAITLIGVGMAYLLSGAVFAEVIFSRPGIGSLIVRSVAERNYPVVMGCVIVTTGLFVIATILADLANAMLDPRARESL